MKKILLITIMAATTCVAAQWTGHVSDSKCGAKHSDHSAASIACVNACVKGGQAPVFVTQEGKVVKIENPDTVQALLGHEVKVTGEMHGDMMTVSKVENVAPAMP